MLIFCQQLWKPPLLFGKVVGTSLGDNCLTRVLDSVGSRNPGFRSEAELVSRLIRSLSGRNTPWGRVQLLSEWDYRSGITDVLARTNRKEVIAFEAKLSDWRRAIYQAYRNTSFASRSYVVLPNHVAKRAERTPEMFGNYGVGLCACDDRGLSVLIEAHSSEPLMEWLTKRAHATFDGLMNVTKTPRSDRPRQSPLPAA
jgi:hypothetical protein